MLPIFPFFFSTHSSNFFFLVAVQSLDVLAGLLNDGNAWTVKTVVQSLVGAYLLLFRRMCVTDTTPVAR